MNYTCDECRCSISAEQSRVMGCCTDCAENLHRSWAALDREWERTRDPLS